MNKPDGRKNNGRKAGTTKNKVQGEIAKAPRKVGSSKKDFSDYSALTNDEFLKVKEGESQEQWELRTSKRRIIKLKNTRTERYQEIFFMKNGKITFVKRYLTGMKKDLMMNVRINFNQSTFDFMKHYAFVMRWATIRFGILKDDLEIGFYLAGDKPFTVEEFDQICLQLGAVRGVFHRFYKNGYICELVIDMGDGKTFKRTKVYALTNEFSQKIFKIYQYLTKLLPVTELKGQESLNSELLKMYEEANETIKGLRKPETIRFRNETEE
jgi:hypothetical protein